MTTYVTLFAEIDDAPTARVLKGEDKSFINLSLGSTVVHLPGCDVECAAYARQVAMELLAAAQRLEEQTLSCGVPVGGV
jgi:hypothetical protein